MHDENLYQILYTLSDVVREDRYADEADRTLKWFFEHCQSEITGLFAWGEHTGWDFHTESLIEKKAGTTHEYFRPWVLWARSFELAPEACARFARGVWEHQIYDHETVNFSRHARYDVHGPGRNHEFPRHGGFYIATWAHCISMDARHGVPEGCRDACDVFRRPSQSQIRCHSSRKCGAFKGQAGVASKQPLFGCGSLGPR